MLNRWHSSRLALAAARAAVFFGVFVLVCVPALTRIGQRLETASHTPSFSKNIDCPPKKVTVASSFAVTLPFAFKALASVAAVPSTPSHDTALPSSPFLSIPPPLRAPPSSILA